MCSDGTVIGPFWGGVIGTLWATQERVAQARANALGGLRRKIRKARDAEMLERAHALAAADLTVAFLDELSGKQPVRLCTPTARPVRNQEYAVLTARHLSQPSKGRTSLSALAVQNLASQNRIK